MFNCFSIFVDLSSRIKENTRTERKKKPVDRYGYCQMFHSSLCCKSDVIKKAVSYDGEYRIVWKGIFVATTNCQLNCFGGAASALSQLEMGIKHPCASVRLVEMHSDIYFSCIKKQIV